MRTLYRLSFVLVIGLLAVGPILAAPHLHSPALVLTAPGHLPADSGPLGQLVGAPVAFAMSIRIKDTGTLAKKFVQRAQAAGGDYTEGVKAAGGDWETNTKNSEDNYAAGVQQAIGDKRFGKGVAAAGAGKYTARASTLGAQRYPGGVAISEGDWAKGVQPHLQAMASMQLPPRRPKGDPQNQARAQAVAALNRQIKLGK